MKKPVAVITLTLVLASVLLAQTATEPDPTADSDAVFAPFTRNLRIAIKGPQVRISWEDNSGIAASFLIYRSTKEIGSDNLAQASLVAEVKGTDNFYTDVPPASGTYFYAVLLKDMEGTVYEYFIPFRNKTIDGVSISNDPSQADLAAELSNIKAVLNGRNVEVSALSSRTSRSVSLYRSSTPLKTAEDLGQAVLLSTVTGASLRFVDTPIPGVPYYYAAIDTVSLSEGNARVVAGQNVLLDPIEIPLATQNLAGIRLPPPRPVRAFPLPDLNQFMENTSLPKNNNKALEGNLQDRINKVLALVSVQPRGTQLPAVKLLPSDRYRQDEVRGNAASLRDILQAHFLRGEYAKSLEKLTKLSVLELSGETKIKTRYYLGLSKAMVGNTREAVLDLLVVRAELGEYVEPWLNSLLSQL